MYGAFPFCGTPAAGKQQAGSTEKNRTGVWIKWEAAQRSDSAEKGKERSKARDGGKIEVRCASQQSSVSSGSKKKQNQNKERPRGRGQLVD
jgi:hypothetical protein